jgi:hypothetical protein
LFLVGAAKAGTTSLWFYLSQHPDIFMAPTKEPHYFSQIRPAPRLAMFFPHITTTDDYLALFQGRRTERVVGEASTSYLWDERVPARIKAVSPEARVLIILRDPVARAHSHYWNDAAEGIDKRSFLAALQQDLHDPVAAWGVSSLYLQAGLYAESVARYMDLFPGRVHVVFFEEFISDMRGHMRDVFSFLGVDPSVAGRLSLEPQNPSKLPRNDLAKRLLRAFGLRRRARELVPHSLHPPLRALLVRTGKAPDMEPAAGRLLTEYYREDIEKLAKLLGRDVPW